MKSIKPKVKIPIIKHDVMCKLSGILNKKRLLLPQEKRDVFLFK